MVSALLLLSLAAAPVDGNVLRFKAFFAKADELFSQGDYGAAAWNFREADRVRRTPEVAFNLAKCHEKLGDKAYATYYFRLYLRRAPKAPDVLAVAERIGEALSDAEAEGRGLLEIEAAISGAAILGSTSYAEFPIVAFLPPGDYEVTASFPGGLRKRTVSMRTGRVTALDFEPLPPPLVTSSPADSSSDFVPSAELATTAASSRASWRTPSYGLLGASAAVLALGSVLGAMASADEGRLLADRSQLTVSQARDLAGASNTKGGVANVLWVAGAAGAVVGGVMFVVSMPEPFVAQSATEGTP